MAQFYRKFIKKFSIIAAPLYNLTRKDVKFIWSEDCKIAFQTLKELLTSPPILIYPDFSQPFYPSTDASGTGLGFTLAQRRDGKEHAILYGGRQFTSSEMKYSTSQREALAIVVAVKRFKSYVYGRHFYICTDHQPLTWIFSLKRCTGILARWALTLQAYDFTILYQKGSANANADALSRMEYPLTLHLKSVK